MDFYANANSAPVFTILSCDSVLGRYIRTNVKVSFLVLIKIVFSSVLSACSFYLFDQKEQVWFKVKGDSNLNVKCTPKMKMHSSRNI